MMNRLVLLNGWQKMMNRLFLMMALSLVLVGMATAQIRVNPTGVNVNSQNPTTVFLTFGPVPPGYSAAEAIWCGELTPAPPPSLGNQCLAGTVYGSLPARYNRSTSSGNQGFTDIMAIPSAVVRRAYQAAVGGSSAGFFYVRRFVSTNGDPDQFVAVTCRMTGGGARVPFALTDVSIKTSEEKPILFIRSGEEFPEVVAEIRYNGTGRLKGRWEIVQPGEEPPEERDLLTEATLPVEERGTQKRYREVGRFNHFLPPVGKFRLKLELKDRVPTLAEGGYQLLLRIEASDDKESDSNLQVLGVGTGTVHSGAVASFPMPSLKFFVTGKDAGAVWADTAQVLPQKDLTVDKDQPLVFSWRAMERAAAYRLEVLDEAENPLISAILIAPVTSYRAPSWFWTRFGGKKAVWRIIALDQAGQTIGQTEKRQIVTK
ncbi:MAG: hypothetical protein R2747_23165 [Pyrinomonadaceae bacterium]